MLCFTLATAIPGNQRVKNCEKYNYRAESIFLIMELEIFRNLIMKNNIISGHIDIKKDSK